MFSARSLLCARLVGLVALGACSRPLQHSASAPAPQAPLVTVTTSRGATDGGAGPAAAAFADVLPTARPAPELAALLERRQLSGVIALLDDESGSARCSHVALCQQRFVPASTFKIPNSIIGLETGVISDADFLIAWDGVHRNIETWNHDHTLRTAFRDSVVPYYQELARRVGLPRMQAWVDKLDYGNLQLGARVDQFWLEGPLGISPLEQLRFLRRLFERRLPISARTRDILLDISQRGELGGGRLYGKTGWAAPGTPDELGWFVGFLEHAGGVRYVAVAVMGLPPGVDMKSIRPQLAEEALLSSPR
jgi:beta-lactamase class D